MLLAFVWTFAAMYGFQLIADFYFLNSDPAFYTISGLRLLVFIFSALLGSAAAGALLKESRLAIETQLGAILGVLAGVYVLCDPRVCFSAGSDGLEPFRLGLLLGSVAISGVGLGERAVGRPTSPRGAILTLSAGFVAVAFFPVIFDLAGARLLPPLHPWALGVLLFVVSVALSTAGSLSLGRGVGFLLPFGAFALLMAASVGIAAAYLPDIVPDGTVMAVAVSAGAGTGALFASPRACPIWAKRAGVSMSWGVAIVLVLLMTLVVIPDAVNGIIPQTDSSPTGGISMGVPVYVGGYLSAPLGHADGAGATVSFAGTNASTIQEGNFIAAGIGIHSANCCVDGIDYSYRFDLYLFHDGSESIVASGWEVCDDNLACGGHSWKVLLLSDEQSLGPGDLGVGFRLRMNWDGGAIVWSYSTGLNEMVNFTSFKVPPQENRNFNTGVAAGGSLTSEQSAAYFFQFGVMSRYPIGHGGWKIAVYCPSIEQAGNWECIQHAKTVQGDQSFWKVLWRWGESYPNVSVSSAGKWVAQFEYRPGSTTGNFEYLW